MVSPKFPHFIYSIQSNTPSGHLQNSVQYSLGHLHNPARYSLRCEKSRSTGFSPIFLQIIFIFNPMFPDIIYMIQSTSPSDLTRINITVLHIIYRIQSNIRSGHLLRSFQYPLSFSAKLSPLDYKIHDCNFVTASPMRSRQSTELNTVFRLPK